MHHGLLGEQVDGGRRPAALDRRLYLLALERGFLDALLDRLVVAPFWALASALDRVDRRLCGPEPDDD